MPRLYYKACFNRVVMDVIHFLVICYKTYTFCSYFNSYIKVLHDLVEGTRGTRAPAGGVEEAYKTFKKVLHIEHFTGKSSLAIKQDFYAKVFMMNMASMVRSQGGSHKKKSRKNRYQINKTQSLAKLKDFLIDIFYKSGLRKLIQQMLKILHKRIEMIRPGRSFPRNPSSARRRQKTINLKGI
jgi:hypothetical protein